MTSHSTCHAGPVRWDDLFADLDGQLVAAEAAELRAEVTERTRVEQARLTLVERLVAQIGRPVTVGVAGLGPLGGQLVDAVGAWLVLSEGTGRSVLVPAQAWQWFDGLGRLAGPAPGALARRSSLGTALRSLAARRVAVVVHLQDGTTLEGTVDRVAADHIDLALHAVEEPRRRGSVVGVRAVPQPAIVAVRFADERS